MDAPVNVCLGEMGEVRLLGYKCERCYHVWVPRILSRKPTICPACKSPYWDKRRGVRVLQQKEQTGQT
jgi:uncharacterized OB-fold protein